MVAESEDAVEGCLAVGSESLTSVEACILTAASEDEVEGCLAADETNNIMTLGDCLKAANSSDDVDECILVADLGTEHSFG